MSSKLEFCVNIKIGTSYKVSIKSLFIPTKLIYPFKTSKHVT